MAVDALVHSFNTGELSFSALARVDQEKTRLGAKIQENLLPFTIGQAMMRPGTTYLGNSASNNKARGIAFLKSINPVAMAGLELTNALLRVWVNDALVTRPSVGTTITGGTFPNSSGWTVTTGGDGSAVFSGSLVLSLPSRGDTVTVDQQITVAGGDLNKIHGLRIVVASGPVQFQVGVNQGGFDYIGPTLLDDGTHSLALTPTGNFWIRFTTTTDLPCTVTSIAVEAAGVMTLPAPWATADLQAIQYAQSADVMFLAHPNWQQRRIERRGDNSWSVVVFKANDGPFLGQSRVEQGITITPGANFGNTTLTASSALWVSSDVGSLWRVDSAGYNTTWNLAALGAYTEPIRIFTVEGAAINKVHIVISGTWSGTLQLEMSLTGPATGFALAGPGANNSFTSNTGGADYDPGNLTNNLVQWFRMGFTAYTSGVATVSISNGQTVSVSPTLIQASGSLSNPVTSDGWGVYRITAFNSSTSVNVQVVKYPTSLSPSAFWKRGLWSQTQGYPTAVTFHDGRLWFGTGAYPYGSKSDSYTSFDTTTVNNAGNRTVTDDASIQRAIATSGSVFNINFMTSMMRLVIGTDNVEVSARSDGFDAPLTPTSCQLKNCSFIGSTPVQPVQFDQEAFYVNRGGNRLYKLFYNFQHYDYDSDDLTEYNTDIGTGGMNQIAVQRNPQPWVWVVRGDGQLLLLLYSIKHQIQGWFRMLFSGASGTDVVESCYVLPGSSGDAQDRLYVWVKRTINGVTNRFLEKMCLITEAQGGSTTKLADAGLFFAGPGIAGGTLTLAHLPSTSGLIAWGTQSGVAQVLTGLSSDGSGNVTLPVGTGGNWTNLFIGLPYTGKYQSSRLAYGAKRGTALLMQKRVPFIGILASNIHKDGTKYGKTFAENGSNLWSLLATQHGQIVAANTVFGTYEENPFPFNGSWDSDSRVCLKVSPGYPATLNGLVVGVETNEL